MTKTHAVLGATALLFATAAVAQPAPPPPGGPRGGPEVGAPPPPGGPRPGPDAPPAPSKGARLRLERGDAKIDVTCAADETMRGCADITLQLLDKLPALKPADAR